MGLEILLITSFGVHMYNSATLSTAQSGLFIFFYLLIKEDTMSQVVTRGVFGDVRLPKLHANE